MGNKFGHRSSLSNFLTVLSMPTTKLYEPPLVAQQGPAGAARSSMDPALGRLVGPSMGFSPVFCSKSELDTQADTALRRGGGVQKASSALATAFHSCIYWNSPVLLYCCYCCFHGIYHQHLSPLILEVAAASEAAIEASSLSTIY